VLVSHQPAGKQTKCLSELTKEIWTLASMGHFVQEIHMVMWRKTQKRAQRALGRSPEEKVKGQGKAVYRRPLMLSTKYW